MICKCHHVIIAELGKRMRLQYVNDLLKYCGFEYTDTVLIDVIKLFYIK